MTSLVSGEDVCAATIDEDDSNTSVLVDIILKDSAAASEVSISTDDEDCSDKLVENTDVEAMYSDLNDVCPVALLETVSMGVSSTVVVVEEETAWNEWIT